MVSYANALLYGVGGIFVAGMALLVALQEKLVYVPVLPGLPKSYPITPARLRLIFEDVWLTSFDGVRLHSWFIKLFPDCRGPTILFFQENAGKVMVLVTDCLHNMAALDHLSQRTDIDTSRIVVFGRSLGGAVGAVLTENNPDKVAALVLENTFTSILDMARVLLPFLKWFIGKSSSKGPRLGYQFFFSLDYKTKWYPRCTCNCYMLRPLHGINSVYLWSFLRECIWIHGCLVVIGIGEQFRSSLKKVFQIRRLTAALKVILMRIDLLPLKENIQIQHDQELSVIVQHRVFLFFSSDA